MCGHATGNGERGCQHQARLYTSCNSGYLYQRSFYVKLYEAVVEMAIKDREESKQCEDAGQEKLASRAVICGKLVVSEEESDIPKRI